MTRHRRFTDSTGVPVFFCDARSPWQRGTNENTNGLLRQYLPKSTDLAVYSSAELQVIADEINNRPRRSLEWKTPVEVLAARGAMTA
jgi:IS30 family transposase